MEAKEAHAALESQLSSLTEELNTNNTKLCEQERELKELSDCLNQVTSQTAELAFLSSESVLDEEVALPAVCLNKCSKDVQLSSIQDVLDGFQVRAKLVVRVQIQCLYLLLSFVIHYKGPNIVCSDLNCLRMSI